MNNRPPQRPIPRALALTIRRFKLLQKDICSRSKELASLTSFREIDPASLSRYLNGDKDFETETLEGIVAALPGEARLYFYSLLIADSNQIWDWERENKLEPNP